MEFKRFIVFLGALASLAVLMSGCETPAQQLDPQAADFIQPGVTTRADIVKAYGEPNQTINSGNGRTLLIWQLVYWAAPIRHSFAPSEDSTARALSVLVDGNNRVIKKLTSDHVFRTFIGNGNVVIGLDAEPEILDHIKPHQTTRAQVIAMLGQPVIETLNTGGDTVLDWPYETGNRLGGETQFKLIRVIIGSDDVVKSTHTVDTR
jgi:outer membrane protein assembly factor BamE (lipoprotein component of BamABCDE complex)